MIGKQIRKIIKRLFVLSLSFVLVGGVCLRPFLYEVKAGEIAGTVGLLADTVTLWDIFNTVSAGAGVIVANDLLQSASQENIDDILGKPIGYINSQGLIEYTEGTSPTEWDWSGLEEALQNATSARSKIIKGVFGQSGGSGQGGNDNDPWYRKFINWCKSAVQNGKIKTTEILGNVTPLDLSVISLMMGAFLGGRVEIGASATTSDEAMYNIGDNQFYVYSVLYVNNRPGKYDIYFGKKFPKNDNICVFTNFIDGLQGIQNPKIYIANRSNEDINLTYGTITTSNGVPNWNTATVYLRAHNVQNMAAGWDSTYYTHAVEMLGNFKYSTNTQADALTWAQTATEPNIVQSPDVMTVLGPAQGGSWVPTPYYDGEGTGEFEIIPQEVVTNYTTYINNNNLTDEEVGEAFEEAINPYVQTEPSPNPNPTTAPEPVATPTTAPAYDPEAELGTAANPVTVADPDYLPGVAAGEGQLPGISAVFPFSIPWDLKYILDMFTTDQDALAPHFEWTFNSTIFGNLGTIVIDLAQFDSAAAIARKLEFLLFALALAIGTKNLIWS